MNASAAESLPRSWSSGARPIDRLIRLKKESNLLVGLLFGGVLGENRSFESKILDALYGRWAVVQRLVNESGGVIL